MRRSVARLLRRIQPGIAAGEGARAEPKRAEFLAAASAFALSPQRRRGAPRVVIAGAGAAGLTCAYRLAQAGIVAQVYEASSRVGGRTWTLRDYFAQGQLAEHGGEFISTEHLATRRLAHELGLTLVNVNAPLREYNDVYYFGGAPYTVAEAKRDYAALYATMKAALRAAGYPTTYRRSTPAGRALDAQSVVDWIEANVPGGAQSRLGALLACACTIEYGGDATAQSALNLIYLLGFEHRGSLGLAGTDEAYWIRGGNDRLASALVARLSQGAIATDSALAALRRNADGTYTCMFDAGARTFAVVADHVVLAMPFTLLRRIDTGGVPFSPRKRTAIANLPMGSNAKIHLQFSSRAWYELGYDGTPYSQFPYECSWEVSVGQSGQAGILVGYPGGAAGRIGGVPAHGPVPAAIARAFLGELEPLYPGIGAAWTGAGYLDVWALDPWHLGSYSYYEVGDYTSFAGVEGEREGNVHFCGEHTSYDFQGYINGAVVSGERVATEVVHG